MFRLNKYITCEASFPRL